MSSARKRKPGAPAGNTNALKHGFYSRRFRTQEAEDLSNLDPCASIEPEIQMIRVLTSRMWERYCDLEGSQAVGELVPMAYLLERLTTRLVHLMMENRLLKGEGGNELTKAFQEALDLVYKELSL
jgi:hypothetical protein